MKSFLLILATFGLTGGKPPLCQSVDLIELNHKYEKSGKHTFSQVIHRNNTGIVAAVIIEPPMVTID